MRQKIFRNVFLVGASIMLLCISLFVGVLYSYFEGQLMDALADESLLAARGVELMGLDYLGGLESDHRVTWVADDGTVLFDSGADATTLDNHADRKEIQEAMSNQSGTAIRHSSTLSQRTLYFARRLEDGSVLRLASAQYTLGTLLLSMLYPILLILMLALVLSFLLASRLTRRIIQPILNLDLEHPEQADTYDELSPLLTRIKHQNQTISQQMEQREALRREFTANVSHELRTPLTAISGIAEILKNGMVRPEDIKGFAADIYSEAQRLIALVQDIIHLSELDENSVTLDAQSVELYDLAQTVAQRLSVSAAAAQVSIHVTGQSALVNGVPHILEETIYNLCDNAIKYNRPQGQVEISTQNTGRGVELTVADTGIGIPADDQPRVFERFYRVDKSHSKAIGGTGLGLSIVKHGAAFHNAQIEMESRLNVGTTIRVIFPNE